MKAILSLLALSLSYVPLVAAHYRWTSLIVNGQTTQAYQYVRQNSNYNSPVTDVTSKDLTCNAGATSPSQTATVSAGATVGFALDQAIYHHGVINVYLSKAPGSVSSYDGSGKWFKISQLSAVTNGGQSITFPADNITQYTFKIPSATPTGEYLLRIEHIALHSASSAGGAQFYISCAQVSITNGGSGSPSPLVSITQVYKNTDPGIMINIYYPIPPTYQQPGPAPWSG